MKRFFSYLSLVCVALVSFTMVACTKTETDEDPSKPTPTPTPDVECSVTFGTPTASEASASVVLTVENYTDYAYIVEENTGNNKATLPALIFAEGTKGKLTNGENTIKIEQLTPGTSYIVWFAFAYKNIVVTKVEKVTLETATFSDELTIYDVDYMSAKAYFNYPSSIPEGSAVKWLLSDVACYNSFSDAEPMALCLHDATYQNYVTSNTNWVFTEENNWFGDDNELFHWTPIVPNQPMYLILCEYAYTEEEVWYRAGWGPGYYIPAFRLEEYYTACNTTGKFVDPEPYYTGYHRTEFFTSKAPGIMKDKPTIDMNLTPLGGKITLTPTDNIYAMCYAILDSQTYLSELLPLLNNNKDYLQWYFTSYHAFAIGQIARNAYGQVDIILEKDYWMTQGTQYTLFITSLSDENGSKQSYTTKTFTLPRPTKPAPSVEVKGVDKPADEVDKTGAQRYDEVYFNLKTTSESEDNKAYSAKYIANYERDWAALVQQYKKNYNMTEEEANVEVINTYGASLTAEELAALNSPEGWTICIETRADATTYCGAVIMNDHGVYSAASIGSYRSLKEPAAPAADMSKLNALKGDWTATATVKYVRWFYDETRPEGEYNYQAEVVENLSCKVTIGEVGYEATLPESVYDIFFKSSNLTTREQVDAVYEQFKGSVDDFNDHVASQNRVLCQGFDLVTQYGGHDTVYASPYELFIADSKKYTAYNYESPIFDFGPKWYLEIDEQGNITAPFNVNYFSPAAQWNKYIFSFLGCSETHSLPNVKNDRDEIVNGHFPVTVSEDGNTITINPLVYGEAQDAYYPQLARTYIQGGSYTFQLQSRIVTPIVLTRGYTEPAQPASKQGVRIETQTAESMYDVKPGVPTKSRTAFPTDCKLRDRERVNYHIVSSEEFKGNIKKFVNRVLNKE